MPSRRFSQGRRNKIAMRQVTIGQTLAATENAPSVFGELFTVALVVLQGVGGGHWPEPVFLSRRIADGKSGDFFLELFDQRIADLVINVDSRHRRALLSAQAIRRTHDPSGSAFEVSIPGNNAGVLAAHLGDARPRIPAIGHAAIDMHTNVKRSGEGYSGGIRMLQQALTNHAAAASLEHDGVTGDQSRSHGPACECKWKVIGCDDQPGTIRLHHAAIARTETR